MHRPFAWHPSPICVTILLQKSRGQGSLGHPQVLKRTEEKTIKIMTIHSHKIGNHRSKQLRTWTTKVECRTPARSTSRNFSSTGLALWEFCRKKRRMTGRKAPAYREKVAELQVLLLLDSAKHQIEKGGPPKKGGGIWVHPSAYPPPPSKTI